MRNARHDELVAHQSGESIAIRMVSFGDEFERLARTAEQRALAEGFKNSVHEVASEPVIAAHLQPLGEWLKGNCDQFEQLARTAQQKDLAASFKEFIAEMTGPEIREVFQRPLVNGLFEEIKEAMADGHSNGFPIAWLSDDDKKEFLRVNIDWTDYLDRGLDLEPDRAAHIERIIDNAIAGIPCEQWMGRTNPPTMRLDDLRSKQSDRSAGAREEEKHRGIER